MKYLLIYLIIINALGLYLMLADKQKAKKGYWRISEKALIITAILGGSLGCMFGMCLAHHKTTRSKFAIGLPVIFVLQMVVALILLGIYL